MAPNADPWRTLGLAPGATQDEIRRAYRRLAKVNHPDAAGDQALPRFLAIQAAYEQLAGPGRVRRVGARPASRPPDGPATNGGEREPWRADPSRARASGRADGRRAPGARPTGTRRPETGPSGEARPGPSPAGAHGAGNAGRTAGGPGRPPDGGPRSRSDGEPRSPSDGPASAGSRRARPGSASRRSTKSAKPGSTSYEGADQEPFEPDWSGATWYGASSGTYWTINPKEYADPRKHGPEYQARARRAAEGWILDDVAADGALGPDTTGGEPATDHPKGAADGRGSDDRPSDDRPSDDSDAGAPRDDDRGVGAVRAGPRRAPVAGAWTARRPGGGGPHEPGDASRSARRAGGSAADGPATGSHAAGGDAAPGPASGPGGAGGAGGASGPAGRTGGPPLRGGVRSWIEPPAPHDGFRGPLLRDPGSPTGRLALALLGWPPLGVLAASAIDSSTGCGRFAASCPEISSPGTWIVHAAIILLLLALPRLALWSAHGTIAALVIGVPAAVVLSAAGGTNVRDASAPLLLSVLAAAYLIGILYAIVGGRRAAPA